MPKATLAPWVLGIATVLAACGGGGGGGLQAPMTTIPPAPSATPPASTTTTPATPADFATAGGPSFWGPNYQSNVSFSAISNSSQAGSTIRSPQDATVIVVENSKTFSTLRVVIPSIGLDETASFRGDARGFQGDTPFYGMNYVVLGEWAQWSSGTTGGIADTLFGYETPVSAIPTSGNAQFSGWASGVVFMGSNPGHYIDGYAAISVDFLSGKITGALTSMTAGGIPWNDVSVSGGIAGGTNTFTGTTAVTNTTNSPLSLTGSATGRMDGKFYGPGAENIGALWSLTDGTGSALGGFLAGR